MLLVAACAKKGSDNQEDTGAIGALDRATLDKEEQEGPKKPIDGVALDKLDESQKARFGKLVDSLVSPCGKAESLRKSATVTKDCKRSLHAARYVALLLENGVEDDKVRKFYGLRYVDRKALQFKLGPAVPRTGPEDAPVIMVEFYDYGCHGCKDAHEVLEETMKAHGQDLVIYYKQNPIIDRHPDSGNAAQGALAAHKQGKFKEMHDALFAGFGKHKRDDVFGYAREIGLDMDRFATDYAAAAAQVEADLTEGDGAGVRGTPTIFINGHSYEDPLVPELFTSWIEEELAVNR